ncbi:hypothetical protein LTR53_010840 [Teratosphaeriaceae sp. CCFEE 6253]|nr:hypothetical protein LTR53_010840 [Teratosphaeriaceae sp. CCFEE 6253]
MAASGASPSGFSYAQAAKGRSPAASTAQTQSPQSKGTSGAVTPAMSTLSELTPSRNWADDVEATIGEKQAAETLKPSPEIAKSATSTKDSSVERAKSEDKVEASGVSSPDLVPSASTTMKEDDSSSAPTNGSSSETTWETKSETKSQASEPSWIVDREKRQQANSQKSDSTVKVDKKSNDEPSPPPPKPILQEAPPPPVNIWQKRAEAQKAQIVVTQPPALKGGANVPASPTVLKENQRPRADSRKSMSVGNIPLFGGNSEYRKTTRGAADGRAANVQQSAKHAADAAAPAGRANLPTRASVPNIPNAPSFGRDENSWPTPDTVQDRERKDESEKGSPEKHADDSTPGARGRKKPEWNKLAVTPNILWESQNAKGAEGQRPPGAERGGRGGARGRGSLRGGAPGANGGARPSQRGSVSLGEDEAASAWAPSRGRSDTKDRQAMPPPAKPTRASSPGLRRGQTTETQRNRSSQGRAATDLRPHADAVKPAMAENEGVTPTSSWVEAQSTMQRTSSPNHMNSAVDAKNEDHVPEPIPRRSSVGTQTDDAIAAPDAPRGGPPIRMVPSDAKKELKSFDGYKEANSNGIARGGGGKRGGRGRGGARDFANSHQTGHSHANGDMTGSPVYGIPPSSSAYNTPRGNHMSHASQGGRGGWSRGNNSRSHSIPFEGYQNGYANQYSPGQVPRGQGYAPRMYDYNGYPVSAMPYQPFMEQQLLMAAVSMQLEYYFSIDNLLKDLFLRSNMDSQGFVFFDVVANFNRLKNLTQDRSLLKEACLASENIEIRVGEDGKERLRRRDGYQTFLLPMDDRAEAARTDGPKTLHLPERPQVPPFPATLTRMQQLPRFDRRSYDGGYQMKGAAPSLMGFSAVSEGRQNEIANGDDTRGRTAKSPATNGDVAPAHKHVPVQASSGEKETEPDAFQDAQISSLTVMVGITADPPFHSAATRTFSNGSIDSRSIFAEMEKANGKMSASTPNGDHLVNGASPESIFSKAQSAEPNAAPQIYWVKDQAPQPGDLPGDLSSEPYTRLRLKALEQRNHAATGTCPYDLIVLYKFWTHFLLRNFNAKMYHEFHYYAHEDARIRLNYQGLECLINFYDQALHSHALIRDRVVRDYVQLVENEPAKLEGAAFKQLRAAWRDGALNLKNRKKLVDVVGPALKARVDYEVASP